MINYKLLLINNSQSRWIHLGLFTHFLAGSLQVKPGSIITTDNQSSGKSTTKSLVIFDAMNLMGRDYKMYESCCNKNIFENIFVVGDIISDIQNIPICHKLQLLFNQGKCSQVNTLTKTFQSIPLKDRIRYKIFPGFIYAIKDLIKHPIVVLSLICKRRTLLFAGQNGIHSLNSILLKHKKENNPEEQRMTREVIEIHLSQCRTNIHHSSTSYDLSEEIINTHNIIMKELESSHYAVEQPFFHQSRETVVFKSVFRFVMIDYLEKKGLLTFIEYPKQFIRVYNSKLYKKHLLIDFGGVNGYESLYPRIADINCRGLKSFQFNQSKMKHCQTKMNCLQLSDYLKSQLLAMQHQLDNN